MFYDDLSPMEQIQKLLLHVNCLLIGSIIVLAVVVLITNLVLYGTLQAPSSNIWNGL